MLSERPAEGGGGGLLVLSKRQTHTHGGWGVGGRDIISAVRERERDRPTDRPRERD